jgi:methionyl-tRNA formyltransferase
VTRTRTVFLGTGAFGVGSLRALAESRDVEIVGVVTGRSRPSGRSQERTPSPIAREATSLGLAPVLAPDRLRAPDAIAAVLALDPAFAVLADYGQIVPPALLTLTHGALNLHPSLLPRHRGATPIPTAILSGDAETGVTLFRMDDGLDTGPIVASRRVPLTGTETTPELEERLAGVAATVLADSLGPWLRRELSAVPQDGAAATLTRTLRREDGRLDPERSAAELERQVRAYQPWPGSFIDTAVGRIIVWEAEIEAAREREDATVSRIERCGLSTADGSCLVFRAVQPAGGRRMSWDAFVRGRPGIVGSTVVPAGSAR